eukprot:m.138804 g.138804  ORF g.138804 m.138804 type:complete len:319 (-) comp17039_c0_seq3:99-1055(-)
MTAIATTSPSRLINGPPLLPSCTEASVCRYWSVLAEVASPSSWPGRPMLETTPNVTELRNERGEPHTTSQSPGLKEEDEPRRAQGRRSSVLTLRTQMSLRSSTAWTLAGNVRPSLVDTVKFRDTPPRAMATTCALVITVHSVSVLSMIKPEPLDSPRRTKGPSEATMPAAVMCTTAGLAISTASAMAWRDIQGVCGIGDGGGGGGGAGGGGTARCRGTCVSDPTVRSLPCWPCASPNDTAATAATLAHVSERPNTAARNNANEAMVDWPGLIAGQGQGLHWDCAENCVVGDVWGNVWSDLELRLIREVSVTLFVCFFE